MNYGEHGASFDIDTWRDTQADHVARMATDDLQVYRSILMAHVRFSELRADSIEERELLYLVNEELRTREVVSNAI